MFISVGTGCEIRLIDPPKFVGPIVAAVPGLRSKSVAPIHCDGKKAQEWWVGVFVSLNGMPSNVIEYWPSEKPRKYVLLSPNPTPFGFTLKVPGDIRTISV